MGGPKRARDGPPTRGSLWVGNQRCKISVLDTDLESGPERSQALLGLLRHDKSLCDAVIVINEHEIPVHRAVVGPLSNFFATALSGDFSEAKTKRLSIRDASLVAISLIVDFAYGVNVSYQLHGDCSLACEVGTLSDQYQIKALGNIARAATLRSLTVECCVSIYIEAKLHDWDEEVKEMRLFMARNYSLMFCECLDFRKLKYEDLLCILNSKDLIATEKTKFESIKSWVSFEESRKPNLEQLLFSVRFELLDRDFLEEVLLDLDLLPKAVLARALQTNIRNGLQLTCGLCEERKPVYPGREHFDNVDFVLKLGATAQEIAEKSKQKFFFKLDRLILSACVALDENELTLVLEVERRESSGTHVCSLKEDVANYFFHLSLLTKSERGVEMGPLIRRDIFGSEIVSRYFLGCVWEDGASNHRELNLFVSMSVFSNFLDRSDRSSRGFSIEDEFEFIGS